MSIYDQIKCTITYRTFEYFEKYRWKEFRREKEREREALNAFVRGANSKSCVGRAWRRGRDRQFTHIRWVTCNRVSTNRQHQTFVRLLSELNISGLASRRGALTLRNPAEFLASPTKFGVALNETNSTRTAIHRRSPVRSPGFAGIVVYFPHAISLPLSPVIARHVPATKRQTFSPLCRCTEGREKISTRYDFRLLRNSCIFVELKKVRQ